MNYENVSDNNGKWLGAKMIIDTPTEDQKRRLREAQDWRDERDSWVGMYLLNEYGYEIAFKYFDLHKNNQRLIEYFKTFFPCLGADGQ